MSADSIIKKWVDDPRSTPTAPERSLVISHIATAAFATYRKTAEVWSAGATNIVGEPHPSLPGVTIDTSTELTSWEAHTAKRIKEGEWEPGTTPDQYLADIRASVLHPEAQMYVGAEGRVRDEHLAAVATDAAKVAASAKMMKPRAGKAVFVIYSATHRNISSAYQKGPDAIAKRLRLWRRTREIPRMHPAVP